MSASGPRRHDVVSPVARRVVPRGPDPRRRSCAQPRGGRRRGAASLSRLERSFARCATRRRRWRFARRWRPPPARPAVGFGPRARRVLARRLARPRTVPVPTEHPRPSLPRACDPFGSWVARLWPLGRRLGRPRAPPPPPRDPPRAAAAARRRFRSPLRRAGESGTAPRWRISFSAPKHNRLASWLAVASSLATTRSGPCPNRSSRVGA